MFVACFFFSFLIRLQSLENHWPWLGTFLSFFRCSDDFQDGADSNEVGCQGKSPQGPQNRSLENRNNDTLGVLLALKSLTADG